MLKTFAISYRLRITYRANAIIFALRQLPLIRKLLPESLYASTGLKKTATVLASIYEVIKAFAGKLIYILAGMYFLPMTYVDVTNVSLILLTYVFLTLIGAYANTELFHASKDKYYAIFLMRLDAAECVKAEYIYFLLNRFLSFYPAVLVLGALTNMNLGICLLMPVFMISVKLCWSALQLRNYEKSSVLYNEDSMKWAGWGVLTLFTVAGYGLPALGIGLPEIAFVIITLVCVGIAIPSFLYLIRYDSYKKLCRMLFAGSTVAVATKETRKSMTQEVYRKKIELTEEKIDSNKTGFAYFHDIFVKRHRKLFKKPTKIMTLILLGAVALLSLITVLNTQVKEIVHEAITNYYPYSLLLLYFINRGGAATETMFRNCDQSMLSFAFYRQPRNILALFKERLKTMIRINLLPATVLAAGLPLLLLLSGGTENIWDYLLIIVSVYGMTTFFSVHTLVMYYLFQPYNKDLENKNIIFTIVNMLTYFICYGLAGKKIPTTIFGGVTIIFCAIYVPIALLLAYKLAPKTFRLR